MMDDTDYLHVCPTVEHDILGTADPNSMNTGTLKKKARSFIALLFVQPLLRKNPNKL